MMLEQKIREEAGEFDTRLKVAFKKMLIENINDTPPILEELKSKVSDGCYNDYLHIYDSVLMVYKAKRGEL